MVATAVIGVSVRIHVKVGSAEDTIELFSWYDLSPCAPELVVELVSHNKVFPSTGLHRVSSKCS